MQSVKQYFTQHPNRLRYIGALVGFLLVVGLFASLADEVHDGDTMTFDKSVLVYLRDVVATPPLDTAMVIATDFGGVLAVSAVTALLAGIMWKRRMFSRATVLLLTMGGVAAGVSLLKVIFTRERPADIGAIVSETSFSFPSGHSMGSMGLAVIVVLLLWQTRWRVAVLVAAVVYVLLIGFSRMYLGVHYPTDVAAGWLLGAAWAATVFTIFRSNRRFNV